MCCLYRRLPEIFLKERKSEAAAGYPAVTEGYHNAEIYDGYLNE